MIIKLDDFDEPDTLVQAICYFVEGEYIKYYKYYTKIYKILAIMSILFIWFGFSIYKQITGIDNTVYMFITMAPVLFILFIIKELLLYKCTDLQMNLDRLETILEYYELCSVVYFVRVWTNNNIVDDGDN